MQKKPIVSLAQARHLAKKYGTPLYIYKKGIIKRQYKGLNSAIRYSHKKIYFACKANSNSETLKFLRGLGCGVETVSPGEIARAFKAGFKPKDISFTCSNISREELISVARNKVHVHVDSLNQLAWWAKAKLGKEVSLRLNAGFGSGHHSHVVTGGPQSKFGIWRGDLPEALKIAKRFNLKVTGLHQHIGSNILDYKIFLKGVRLILSLAKNLPHLSRLDLGGGISVPYRPGERPFNVQKLGVSLTRLFNDFSRRVGRKIELSLEPGRYLVAESGALLVEVTDIKQTPGHVFAGVNSGFNHLIRPALYGSYHHVHNFSTLRSPKKRVLVAGNICESGDILARQTMPLPKVGDFLLVADAGAYGYSMASDYNSRPKPREIVL